MWSDRVVSRADFELAVDGNETLSMSDGDISPRFPPPLQHSSIVELCVVGSCRRSRLACQQYRSELAPCRDRRPHM